MIEKAIATYDASWDPETGKLVYDEAVKTQAMHVEWHDALDRKVVSVFGVSALLIGVTPALKQAAIGSAAWWAFGLALLLWSAAGVCFVRAYQARALDIVDPAKLGAAEWLSLSPAEYRVYRVVRIGEQFDRNYDALAAKARWLKRGIRFTAAEVLTITIALLLAR